MKLVMRTLLVAAAANTLLWIALIPVWQYSDEQAHFAQVQNIAESGLSYPNVPNNTSYEISLSEKILETERDGRGNNTFTYHPEKKLNYTTSLSGPNEDLLRNLDPNARKELVRFEATENPPLYYLIASLGYNAFHDQSLFERVFGARLISALIFIAMIITAFKISQIIFKENTALQLTLTSLVAFKPMIVFSSTGVLPDPLTNFLFALVLLFSLIIIKSGLKPNIISVLTAVVLLGMLTRQQFIISLPLIIFAIILNQFKISRKRGVIILFLIFLISIAVLTASPSLPEAGKADPRLLFSNGFADYIISALKQTYAQTMPWYWGVYKWLSLTLPPIYYQVINRIVLLSIGGILLWLFLRVKKKTGNGNILYIVFLIASSVIYFMFFIIWDFYFKNMLGYTFGIQGRYFFPLVIAHMALLVFGLTSLLKFLPKSVFKFSALLIISGIILFNDLSLWHISSSYYDTSNMQTFIIQASQYKASFIKGNIIGLILMSALTSQLIFLFSVSKYIIKQNESYTRSRL